MISILVVLVVVGQLGFASAQDSSVPLSTYNVEFNWTQVDFKFPSEAIRQMKIEKKEYIPENNVITGIKVTETRMFLTVPRWRLGVPATLVYIDFEPKSTGTGQMSDDSKPKTSRTASPLLIPYPTWEMQEIGNCIAFQYVQSMEIDQFNRMWILDLGRINIFEEAVNKCPPRLIIMDLATNQITNVHEFQPEVASPAKNFLNDLVVGCETKEDCWAYITDASDAKIIVFNLKMGKSWGVHHSSMMAQEEAKNFTILDHEYKFDIQVDGIALAPIDSKFDTLYYCPLSSYHIYSVPTDVLQKEPEGKSNSKLEDSDVTLVGTKTSQTDGMAMDSKGLLFFGLLNQNSINYWNSSGGKLNESNGELVVRSDIDLQWPDTFAFDSHGYLYSVANRLQRFSAHSLDSSEKNIRVVRIFVGSRSYMYPSNDGIEATDLSTTASSTISSSTPGFSSSTWTYTTSSEASGPQNPTYHPGAPYEHIESSSISNPESPHDIPQQDSPIRTRTTKPPIAETKTGENSSQKLIISYSILVISFLLLQV